MLQTLNNTSPVDNIALLSPTDTFARRHIGPTADDIAHMLEALGVETLDELMYQTIPDLIRVDQKLNLDPALTESQVLREMRGLAAQNKLFRSFIGMGYYDTLTPPVIQRNILENPGWYTQYTPYQAEIAQGRLEALINFQTMVSDLTGMEIANASLLDEGTAAAEAMTMAQRALPRRSKANTFFVSERCHPQTIALVEARALPLGYDVVVGDHQDVDFSADIFGVLVQYPDTDGAIHDYDTLAAQTHENGAMLIVAADLLALTLLRPPGEFGADIVVGNTQRFGVPMGFGGPHAAYLATSESHQRIMPGRLIGVSIDATGKPGYRLALQTREQHIRRDRATSNICTAQVLLAIMASMYAVYHGPDGLKRIAQRVQLLTTVLANGLTQLGYAVSDGPYFDTVRVSGGKLDSAEIKQRALAHEINLRYFKNGDIGISLDEAVTINDLYKLFTVFGDDGMLNIETLAAAVDLGYPDTLQRTSDYMTHPVFNSYHSETEMLRYITRLQNRDLSLAYSMISLGSCTMKLNATTEMMPITWPEFAGLHPFVPADQHVGYTTMFEQLEHDLAEITGFDAVSLQPNSGAQGEYAGLMTIRAFHHANGDDHRHICLIPSSAHGTNPASAVMAGMKVVVVKCDHDGNIDVADLRAQAEKHSANLAALMVTYPSTHGVFEAAIREICDVVHEHGGRVYLDGANMNAQVGLARPGDYGGDVCHLNLHKTFCIPHGGGGPGMGPICMTAELAPYRPNHPIVETGGRDAFGPIAAAPWGSAAILPISYAYIRMMGEPGLTKASQVAILNANYMATRLDDYYPVLYKGDNERVAHECIIDLRPLKESSGVSVEDVTKRLMDYGFHAPTMSFPVPGTLMIEPTESESLAELDKFCDTMIAIWHEIEAVESGAMPLEDSPLHNAPHTAAMITADDWTHPYSREVAAYPMAWLHEGKFWPPVARIDNVYGDRNLMCNCIPIEAFA